MEEHNHLYPMPSGKLSQKRRELAPEIERAFRELGRQVFAAGALEEGAAEQEIMEAIWVAAEMRAGGAFAHSLIALQTMEGDDKG